MVFPAAVAPFRSIPSWLPGALPAPFWPIQLPWTTLPCAEPAKWTPSAVLPAITFRLPVAVPPMMLLSPLSIMIASLPFAKGGRAVACDADVVPANDVAIRGVAVEPDSVLAVARNDVALLRRRAADRVRSPEDLYSVLIVDVGARATMPVSVQPADVVPDDDVVVGTCLDEDAECRWRRRRRSRESRKTRITLPSAFAAATGGPPRRCCCRR